MGALGIYCTQTMITDGQKAGTPTEGGPVGEANADPASASTCCTPPAPKFKPLGTLTVSNTADSATLAVGAYREIVIYVISGTNLSGSCSGNPGAAAGQPHAYFRADATAPFGYVPGLNGLNYGRMVVQGSDLQLRWGSAASCVGSASYAVAGVE